MNRCKVCRKSGLLRFLVDVSRLLTSSMRIPVSLSCWNKFGDPNRREYKIVSIFCLSPLSISSSLSTSQGLSLLLLCLDMELLTTSCQIIIFFDSRNPFFKRFRRIFRGLIDLGLTDGPRIAIISFFNRFLVV